jgi:hypothetical protein
MARACLVKMERSGRKIGLFVKFCLFDDPLQTDPELAGQFVEYVNQATKTFD